MGLINLSFCVFQGYYIIYLQKNGLSYLQMSTIFAISYAGVAIVSLPMGNVADRWGRKKAFALGAVVIGMAMSIYGLTNNFYTFLVAEIVWAVGWGLINGSNEAWIIDELAREGRSSEAARTFTTTIGLTYMLGVFGGLVASTLVVFALNLPFLIAAVLIFIGAAVVLILLSENFGDEHISRSQILKESLSFYRGSKGLQFLTAAEAFRNISAVIYLFMYQPYLVATGLGEEYLGLYYSVLMICSAAGSLLAPFMSERLGEHRTMALSSGGLVTSFILLSISPGLAASCILFALCGLSNGLGWPPLMVWRNRVVPSRVRASALAIFGTFTNLTGAIVTLALGGLLDASSPVAGFALASAVGAGSVPLYLMAARKMGEEKAPLKEGPPLGKQVQNM
jgi:MFS family permease